MPAQTAEQLASKKCEACDGDVPRLTSAEAREQLKNLNGWELTHEEKRIRKNWTVANFMAGIGFFNDVAKIAEAENHHPDLHLENYRNVAIEIWTHSIGCLSENDFILAAKIDRIPVKLKQA